MLSRLAQQMAAEIKQHDWSDAPYRADRAGHSRRDDTNRGADVLTPKQTDVLRLNVIWVTAQVLAYNDPNFNIVEYAAAAGDPGTNDGWLKAGLRNHDGEYDQPGTYTTDAEAEAEAANPNSTASLVAEHRATMEKMQALTDELNRLRPK